MRDRAWSEDSKSSSFAIIRHQDGSQSTFRWRHHYYSPKLNKHEPSCTTKRRKQHNCTTKRRKQHNCTTIRKRQKNASKITHKNRRVMNCGAVVPLAKPICGAMFIFMSAYFLSFCTTTVRMHHKTAPQMQWTRSTQLRAHTCTYVASSFAPFSKTKNTSLAWRYESRHITCLKIRE